MSYILEALKKSDRERKQGEIPDLQSEHALYSGGGTKEHKSSFWIWLVVSVVLLLSAVIVYSGMQSNSVALLEKISALEESVGQLKEQPVALIGPEPVIKEEAAPLQPVTPQINGTVTAAIPEKIPSPVIIEETVIKTADLPRKLQVGATPPPLGLVEKVAAEAAEKLPFIQDLPASIQQVLPKLKLAGHVYAAEAASRMIIINNRICHEGDLVENQLYLDQILWEGVVFRYQDIRFRMNIF